MPHPVSSFPEPAEKHWKYILPFLLFFTFLNVLSWQIPFFWDGILYGRMAIFYQDTNFQQLALPAELDAGHPPLFGLYLALVWQVLGRSLWASHLAMLPLVLGVVWQLWLLARRFMPRHGWVMALLLLSLEPTWLTYATSIGNDVLLVFAYLLALNALLRQQRPLLLVALLLLAFCSLRGIVATAAVGLTELLWLWLYRDRKFNLALLWPYMVTGLAIMAWLVFHHHKTGWYVTTPARGWSTQRQVVDVVGMARNVIIVAWRMLDFGRLVLWAVGLYCFVGLLRQNFGQWQPARQLLVLATVPLVVYTAFLMPFSNPISHRYLLVCILLFGLLAVWLMAHYLQGRKRAWTIILVALAFLSGHFWIYPDPMAKGWDSHLAHLPYFSVRKEAIAYLRQHHIDPTEVGSYFPNVHGTQYSDLDGSSWRFRFKNLDQDRYILESNVFNPPRSDLQELQTDKWKLLQAWQKGAVKMRLYERTAPSGSHAF